MDERLRSWRFAIALAVGVLIFCIPAPAAARKRPDRGDRLAVTAKALLARVASKYEQLKCYEDEGVVLTSFTESTRQRTETMPFGLRFKRPSQFYFEWVDRYLTEDARRSAVWTNRDETWMYREPDTYERKASLEIGIASATGLSYGAAYNIPRLLVPRIRGWAITELTHNVLIGYEIVEGAACYHVRGLDSNEDIIDVWIGMKDYLIRRIKSQLTFSGFSTVKDEIHRNLKTNQCQRFEIRPTIEWPPKQGLKTTAANYDLADRQYAYGN